MWRRRIDVDIQLWQDSEILVHAQTACDIRYVDMVDVFLVLFKWCGPCGGCLCFIVWGVCVAGVAMREVVGWSTCARGREGRHKNPGDNVV